MNGAKNGSKRNKRSTVIAAARKHFLRQVAVLQSEVEELKAKQAYFETVAARLEAMELRYKNSIQPSADKSLGNKMVEVMP